MTTSTAENINWKDKANQGKNFRTTRSYPLKNIIKSFTGPRAHRSDRNVKKTYVEGENARPRAQQINFRGFPPKKALPLSKISTLSARNIASYAGNRMLLGEKPLSQLVSRRPYFSNDEVTAVVWAAQEVISRGKGRLKLIEVRPTVDMPVGVGKDASLRTVVPVLWGRGSERLLVNAVMASK